MTETTQPDPQVVTWMREYLADHPNAGPKEVRRQFLREEIEMAGEFTPDYSALRAVDAAAGMEIIHASVDRALGALTVADIPAGQGAASLFIGRASDGCPVLTFKDEDGDLIALEHGNPTTSSGRAFWDHLAATLPHVTTEDGA